MIISTTPLKAPLTPANVTRLLDLLCEDDTFRAEFASDPTAALEHHDLQEASHNASCGSPRCLARKEEFQNARQLLKQRLTETAVFRVPHFFEAGSAQLQPRSAETRSAA